MTPQKRSRSSIGSLGNISGRRSPDRRAALAGFRRLRFSFFADEHAPGAAVAIDLVMMASSRDDFIGTARRQASRRRGL
jgi:hypothetical protein